MRIYKVDKLNHARFRNFSWHTSLVPFCDAINILFGWNGSGKTTFSDVIRSLEIGNIEHNCSFKIETDLGQITESNNLDQAKGNIRVFNAHYIEEMLHASSTIPYIFYAGKVAVNYDKEEEKLKAKKDEYSKIQLPTKHDEIAKGTANVIREVGGINSIKKQLTGGATYASYDKSDFGKRIINIEKQIDNGDIKSHNELVRPDIDSLKKQLQNTERLIKNDSEISAAAQWLTDNINDVNKLLESEPIQIHSKRIDELTENQTGWVKQGVDLHFSAGANLKKCLFCNSDIKNADELIKHFSEEVVKAINDLDGYLKTIESFTTSFAKLDSLTQAQQNNINHLRSVFDAVTIILREKRQSIASKKTPYLVDKTKLTQMLSLPAVDAASIAYAIEAHFVAQQYESYKREKLTCEQVKSTKDAISAEITQLDAQVRELKQQAKNTHEPAKALNRLFKIVFPYRKIEITDSDDGTGYIIKRDGQNCTLSSLSEGEKNFIALAYFIYSINDNQNKLPEDGVVVIDDPVSSLDKQSIFQIFSIIVNEIKTYPKRQYLILTHNLDFLGHLKEHYRKRITEDKVRLFNFEATNSGCVINTIHPLLKDHRSDYYYVFSILAKHKNFCDLADAHLMVNLLRRWLETFLEFKFTKSDDLRGTIEEAYRSAYELSKNDPTPFSANSLEIYRFINHGSHGFSDTETTDESILNGANLRIQEAFALVEILDPLHYKKLQEII